MPETFQWKKDNLNIDQATSSSYQLDNTEEGLFKCTVDGIDSWPVKIKRKRLLNSSDFNNIRYLQDDSITCTVVAMKCIEGSDHLAFCFVCDSTNTQTCNSYIYKIDLKEKTLTRSNNFSEIGWINNVIYNNGYYYAAGYGKIFVTKDPFSVWESIPLISNYTNTSYQRYYISCNKSGTLFIVTSESGQYNGIGDFWFGEDVHSLQDINDTDWQTENNISFENIFTGYMNDGKVCFNTGALFLSENTVYGRGNNYNYGSSTTAVSYTFPFKRDVNNKWMPDIDNIKHTSNTLYCSNYTSRYVEPKSPYLYKDFNNDYVYYILGNTDYNTSNLDDKTCFKLYLKDGDVCVDALSINSHNSFSSPLITADSTYDKTDCNSILLSDGIMFTCSNGYTLYGFLGTEDTYWKRTPTIVLEGTSGSTGTQIYNAFSTEDTDFNQYMVVTGNGYSGNLKIGYLYVD